MSGPPDGNNSVRDTTSRNDPIGRSPSRASASRLEIVVRGRTVSPNDVDRVPPAPGRPGGAPGQPNPRSLGAGSGRQCWICFVTEEDDRALQWVKPCLCRGTMKWVHQSCLQQWVDQRYAEDKLATPICPHCRTKYLIHYPKAGPIVRFLDFIDRAVEETCPYIVGTVVVGSLYWTALCVGASAFLEAGDSQAQEILETGKPIVLLVTLPFIPAAIIGLGMLTWEDVALEILRTVTDYLPLTGYILPTRVTNVSGIQQNRQISDGMTCTRVFAGASVLPLASKLCGDLLYKTEPSPFLRSFYGGLTFLGVKGLVIMFHKQQTYKRLSQRRILDRPNSTAPLPRTTNP